MTARALLLAAILTVPVEGQERCARAQLETHALSYCVSGAGDPTFVLAAGAGQTSDTWAGLVPALARVGTVVTFDRAGLGLSDPGPRPRTPTRVAAELGKLLDSAGTTAPYIIVGHSVGGIHALRFAELFPDEVAGLVLIDTPPVGFNDRRLELLDPDERRERAKVLAEGLVGVPDAIRFEREGLDAERPLGFEAVPPSTPLAVIVADSQDFGTLGSQDAHRELWVEMSGTWLDLSESARFVLATGSGHMIHRDRTALVRDAVLQLARSASERR